MSRQEGGTGKKLPPTPTKPSNVVLGRKLASLPATPSRQLPKTRTPSEESYYKPDYNEDYNYAYRSQDNLPQDTYADSIYSQQQQQQQPQQPQQQQQSKQIDQIDQHATSKVRYPEVNEDSQYSYVTQVDGQYPYPDAQHTMQNSYGQTTYPQQNSYKDEYQQPYAQQDAQVYQGSYEDTTYPTASQANDHQYANQGKNQFDKPDGMIIEDNYSEMGFNQNNVEYCDYKQQDVYQEQYDDYVSTVEPPSSVYNQNSVTNAYNQYQPDQYDSQYNISTSTDQYQKTYQETYNQVPVTSQDNYQEAYAKQQPQEGFADYQTPYSKQENVPTTYMNNYQEPYQDYQETYDEYQDSYQESFEEQRYKESSAATSDRRQSEVPELSVTTPRGQTRTNGYPSSESEYLYPQQENEDASSMLSTSRRKKLSGKRETSPLLQQNTDSLESRDDELKDSFETAVSSIGSNQLKKGYSEYSTAGESSPAAAIVVESPQSQPQTTPMINHVSVANHVTTTAMVHISTNFANGKRPLARTDSYQEDVVDDEEYPEIMPKELQRKDSQLSHQSQLSQHSQPMVAQKPKLTRGDSYASDFPDESYSRRESYAQLSRKDSFSSVTQDGFKPPLTRTDSYQQRELRGNNYGQSFTAPQPISRAESYQRGHFKDQESIDQSDIVLSNAVNGDYQMRDETLERC